MHVLPIEQNKIIITSLISIRLAIATFEIHLAAMRRYIWCNRAAAIIII